MHLKILPLMLVALSTTVQAVEFPVEIVEYMDSAQVVATLDAADIDESGHWNPFEEPPALPMADALSAVRMHLDADPELKDVTLAGIELKRTPHHENHWHYLVKVQKPAPGRDRFRYFIVLMNGKVIQGLREPQAVK